MYSIIFCCLLVISQQFTTCPIQKIAKRPCSKDFVPVCGKTADGIGTSFANPCEACSSSTITGFDDGLCPFDGRLHPPPLPVVPDYVYCPEPRPLYKCALIDEPACGILKVGLPKDYMNTCMACSDKNVVAYLRGKCNLNICPA